MGFSLLLLWLPCHFYLVIIEQQVLDLLAQSYGVFLFVSCNNFCDIPFRYYELLFCYYHAKTCVEILC